MKPKLKEHIYRQLINDLNGITKISFWKRGT